MIAPTLGVWPTGYPEAAAFWYQKPASPRHVTLRLVATYQVHQPGGKPVAGYGPRQQPRMTEWKAPLAAPPCTTVCHKVGGGGKAPPTPPGITRTVPATSCGLRRRLKSRIV